MTYNKRMDESMVTGNQGKTIILGLQMILMAWRYRIESWL